MKKVITILITLLLTIPVFSSCSVQDTTNDTQLSDKEAFSVELFESLPVKVQAFLPWKKDSISVLLNDKGELCVETLVFLPYEIPLVAEEICPTILSAKEKYSNVTTVSIKIGDKDYKAVWVSEDGERGTLNYATKSSDIVQSDLFLTVKDLKEHYKNELDKYYKSEEEVSKILDSVTESTTK